MLSLPLQRVLVALSVMSDSLRSHVLQPLRFLCPWNPPGKNTGMGSHALLQGIFLTQGLNLDLLHCKQILYRLGHQGRPHHLPGSTLLVDERRHCVLRLLPSRGGVYILFPSVWTGRCQSCHFWTIDRKLGLRDVKQLAQGHSAIRW